MSTPHILSGLKATEGFRLIEHSFKWQGLKEEKQLNAKDELRREFKSQWVVQNNDFGILDIHYRVI